MLSQGLKELANDILNIDMLNFFIIIYSYTYTIIHAWLTYMVYLMFSRI